VERFIHEAHDDLVIGRLDQSRVAPAGINTATERDRSVSDVHAPEKKVSKS